MYIYIYIYIYHYFVYFCIYFVYFVYFIYLYILYILYICIFIYFILYLYIVYLIRNLESGERSIQQCCDDGAAERQSPRAWPEPCVRSSQSVVFASPSCTPQSVARDMCPVRRVHENISYEV